MNGKIVHGIERASEPERVVARLLGRGLLPIAVRRTQELPFERGVSTRDLAIAFRNIALLVANGVPIERAMAVSESLVSERLANALAHVRRMIREGTSVSLALRSIPKTFPGSIVGIVAAGERGSDLSAACETVAEQLEFEADLAGQVRSALAYPLLIVVMGLATAGVMTAIVIPRFAGVLADLGTDLPSSTRLLMQGSNLVREAAIPLILVVLITLPLFRAMSRQPKVRAVLDRLLLGTPLVGPIRHGLATARICRALGSMLDGGLPLLVAVDSAAEATGDHEIRRRLTRARRGVAEGQPLTEALRGQAVLVPVAIQLAGLGESSGALSVRLTRAADLVALQTKTRLQNSVTMIEPLLVIALGIFVAAIAAALLQAVYSVRPI